MTQLASLRLLEKYAARPFEVGYPSDEYVKLYAPEDRIHEALKFVVGTAEHSLVIAMYGFDDDELVEIILGKMKDPAIFVQISLDSTQAAGKHEKAILEHAKFPANTVAFGQSEKHAIMHLKCGVIDGLDVFDGSTNWSQSGEGRQDNELTITRQPIVAARARWKCDTIHHSMLQAAAAKAE